MISARVRLFGVRVNGINKTGIFQLLPCFRSIDYEKIAFICNILIHFLVNFNSSAINNVKRPVPYLLIKGERPVSCLRSFSDRGCTSYNDLINKLSNFSCRYLQIFAISLAILKDSCLSSFNVGVIATVSISSFNSRASRKSFPPQLMSASTSSLSV